MTTNTYTSVIGHTSDADFRAWGSALSASMQTAGLIQTADTGQINWATVTRPGINTAAGYEIYRFNDSLQGTYPIFLKIEYGTHTTTSAPAMWLTVGTGSNGSGTITGQSSTRNTVNASAAPASTVTTYPTYVCYKDGSLGVMLKVGAVASGPSAQAFFVVGRTVDDTGAETGDGFTVFRRQASTSLGNLAQSVSVANSTTFTESQTYSMVHMGVTSSLVGSDKQVYKNYTIQPRVRPVMQVATVIVTEYPSATSFTATFVGATARTYLSGGSGTAQHGVGASSTNAAAMLWE
jgi:hypothetical protein